MHRSRVRSALARLLFVVAAVMFVMAPGGASAQQNARARIDAVKTELGQIETAMQTQDLPEAALQALRARVDPIQDELRGIIAQQTPRLAAAKTRLDQLGPKPEPGKGAPESADVTRERAEQEKMRAESDDILRLARLMSVQSDQLQAAIAERRRTSFTRELFRRNASLVSPVLWVQVVRGLPREGQALKYFFQGAWGAALSLDRAQLLALAGLIAVIAGGFLPFRRLIRRLDSRDASVLDPPKRRRATAAFRIILLRGAVAALFAMAGSGLLDLFEMPSGLRDVASTMIWGLAVVFAIRGLAKAVLAPEAPGWRLFGDDEPSVRRLAELAVTAPALMVAGKVAEALHRAIAATLPMTVVTKGLVAAGIALLVLRAMRLIQEPVAPLPAEDDGREMPGPAVPTRVPFRLLIASAAFVVLAADLFGFVALAGFITDQMIWVVCVGTLLATVVVLVDEIVGRELSSHGRLGGLVQSTVGLRTGSLEQMAVLSAGVLRIVVWVAAVFLVLAPWGIDSNDALAALRAAFFGFSIGGVTISLSAITIALGIFIAGMLVTRAVQRWLEMRYLPITGLDVGLRNSIRTIFGYIGVMLAAMLAFAQLGLSLEKITLLAGALSVGIGFGLQSIVNNFVSGLILLWERPIRVGDWIVVGDEQGIVKRINVRATQIETFDRASLIVPNSEFISGRVKNWMHNDRLGRIVIPVGVAYGADPEHVQKILLETALGHREVLTEPKARVFFVRFGDSSIDFELRCFADIDSMSSVKSDLLYAIFKRLQEEKIDIPFPHRTVEIAGVERLFEKLGRKS